MGSVAHTAGPWHVFEPIDKGSAASIGSWLPGGESRHLIASVWPIYEDDDGSRRNDPQALANAALIAAAPDLLEACKSALERIDGMNEAMGVVDELRAAIARAEQPN